MFKIKFSRILVVLGVVAFAAPLSASNLVELKKRKLELDEWQQKCDAMSEPERSKCLDKRSKGVEKYKRDLERYRADVQKELQRKGNATPKDLKTRMESRDRSIKEFQDYVNSCTERTDRCASAIFQVANLTFQNEEDAFLIKQEEYEKLYTKWEDRDRRGAEPVAPRRNHNGSMAYFDRFLKEYSTHKDVPPALVRSAFIADLQGNSDRSYELLNLLVTRYPDNPLTIPSHLRLGEYWMMKRKYQSAIKHYEKVPVNYPGPEAGLALYHHAEAYYNMADFERAASLYYQYVDLCDAGKLKCDLREEALEFMAASWADMDHGFDAARSFLRDKGKPWENDVYYEIGQKNKAHDRLDESVNAFKFLLQRDPTYPRAPNADLIIVEILVIQKRAEEAQAARLELVQRYTPNSSWSTQNSSNKKAFEDAQKAIKIAMYQIPVFYHTQGEVGEGDMELLGKAEEHYRGYLSRYSAETSWDIYQVHQNLAVVYGKMKQYARSADEWMWCANAPIEKYGKKPAEKKDLISKQDAAFNAVVMMDENRKLALSRLNDDKAAAYNSTETRDYFTTVEKYLSMYGKSATAPDLAYNAAFVHYEAKQYDRAITNLEKLLKDFPNHKHTNLIQRALGQSYLEAGHFDKAETQFRALLRRIPKSGPEYGDVRKSLASTQFKQAEFQGRNGDHSAAALKYSQMARDFEDVEIADKALYEAGLHYDTAGRVEDAARILTSIHQKYPKSPLAIRGILKAASIYGEKGKHRNSAESFLMVQKAYPQDSMGFLSISWAAQAYEKVPDPKASAETYVLAHKYYPKSDKTPSLLYNAGQTYENSNEFDQAVRIYKLLGDEYPKSTYALEAVFSVPLILEKKGDHKRAAAAYEEFAQKYKNDIPKLIRAHLGAGKSFMKMGDEKKGLSHLGSVVQIQDKHGVSEGLPPLFAAEAAYLIGDSYFQKISGIRLNGSKRDNQNNAKIMQGHLAPAITNFAKSAEQGEEEWTLRSTMRMGDVFAKIGEISRDERIQAKGKEERIAEEIQIKMALPGYYDKAREIYEKNLELARNQGIRSPWVDSTGVKFLSMYWHKAQTFEDLGKILASAPLPSGLEKEEREAYQAALQDKAYEAEQQAKPIYKEGLRAASYFALENEFKSRISRRLQELEPEAEELGLKPETLPSVPRTGSASETTNDEKYSTNMERIAKIYENNSLTDDQKINMYRQMEAEAKEEISTLRSSLGN